MNQFFILTLCGALLFPVATTYSNAIHKTAITPVATEEIVQIPSPFIDCTTIEEAETIANFKVKRPTNLPEGYTLSSISTIQNDLVQIIYSNESNEICFRMGKGTDDISGDYNTYDYITQKTINNIPVTMKGNFNKINTAIWTDGTYTFSINIDLETGIEIPEMTTLINSIQ